jgi:hypothetical protein
MLGSFLRSTKVACLVCVAVTLLIDLITPPAVRIWERELVRDGSQFCRDSGGEPLVARDQRVSCAPGHTSKRQP